MKDVGHIHKHMSFGEAAAASSASQPTCNICLDYFNKSVRLPVTCAYCSAQTCRQCFQSYLLTLTEEPFCVNARCSRPLSVDFVNSVTTAAFRNGPYKVHKGKVMTDLERARLPETQVFAQRVDAARKLHDSSTRQLQDVMQKIRDLQFQSMTLEQNIADSQRTIMTSGRQVSARGRSKAEAHERSVFIRPCPVEDCRGFLTTQWNCPLCLAHVCKDCHEVMYIRKVKEDTAGKKPQGGSSSSSAGSSSTSNGEQPVEEPPNQTVHTCDPDKVASVRFVSSHSKPCPKCGCPISKIDGCDQMWCTQCNTAFSWTSGQVVTGRVHNPHYFEWLRRNGDQDALAQDGAAANAYANGGGGCGGEQQFVWNQFGLALRSLYPNIGYGYRGPLLMVQGYNLHRRMEVRYETVQDIRNSIRHLQGKERRILPSREEGFLDLRVSYLNGRISDEDFEKSVQSSQVSLARLQGRIQILDTFVQIGSDLLRRLPRMTRQDLRAASGVITTHRGASIVVTTESEYGDVRSSTNPASAKEEILADLRRLDEEFEELLQFTNAALERHNRHSGSSYKVLGWSRVLPGIDEVPQPPAKGARAPGRHD